MLLFRGAENVCSSPSAANVLLDCAEMFRIAAVALALAVTTVARADPVINTHPRLLLTAAEKSRLLAKKNANDVSWQALKARADTLATYSINPYKSANSGDSPAGTIYYTYQGEGWYEGTLPLAFAYQMTGDTRYSNKLIELAQEMIRAQSDPDNTTPKALRFEQLCTPTCGARRWKHTPSM